MAKDRIRRAVAETLARLTPDRRREASLALALRVAAFPALQRARTVMLFLSVPSEIDTWPIIRWAWREGKRVAIPRIEERTTGTGSSSPRREMVAALLESADVGSVSEHPGVSAGPFGILGAPAAPQVPASEIDVVLAPCQAMDRSGNRLGKGGGFYDRFLARDGLRATVVAVAFDEQLLDEVPVGRHDRPVDAIVTDTQTLTFQADEGRGGE